MNRNSVNWKGNFNAIVTPFTKTGAIDEKAFVENIKLLISEGIDGVVVSGCTGEFWAMTYEERLRLFELAVKAANGKIKVIAGTADILTSVVIRLSLAAKKVGVDGVMITPPYFVVPSFRETMEHFLRISDAVQHPILFYNIPEHQAINITPEQIAELGEKVEYIVAVKQSARGFHDVVETIRLAGKNLVIFAGYSVIRGFPCVAMGADGIVSSVEPQIMGDEAIKLYNLAAENRVEEAKALQYRCIVLHNAIGDTASLKAAMNMMGRPGGYPREPLLEVTEDQKRYLKSVLIEIGLLK